MDLINKKSLLPNDSEALEGRDEEIEVPDVHFLNGTPLKAPFPEGLSQAIFGMGCFWGVEKKFWQLEGVYTTAVGYSGGQTKNPTWILRCDDTHIVQSNSSDLFGYDVVATAGEVQRPGHRTLIVSIASVVKNIIIIKRLHTHKHILRLKWDELLTSISV